MQREKEKNCHVCATMPICLNKGAKFYDRRNGGLTITRLLKKRENDDDVQWFNVRLKADVEASLALAHNAKVKTDMPEKNEKQLESVESVRWVER